MCMKAVGTKTLSGVRSTGFSDDDDIPMWVKPYVSTALLNGSITGFVGENGTVFDADACVSYNEAAVMLSRVMNVTDVVNTAAYVDDTAPSWASQSFATCGLPILDTAACSPLERLTRATRRCGPCHRWGQRHKNTNENSPSPPCERGNGISRRDIRDFASLYHESLSANLNLHLKVRLEARQKETYSGWLKCSALTTGNFIASAGSYRPFGCEKPGRLLRTAHVALYRITQTKSRRN
jgi:hypothetical protein